MMRTHSRQSLLLIAALTAGIARTAGIGGSVGIGELPAKPRSRREQKDQEKLAKAEIKRQRKAAKRLQFSSSP